MLLARHTVAASREVALPSRSIPISASMNIFWRLKPPSNNGKPCKISVTRTEPHFDAVSRLCPLGHPEERRGVRPPQYRDHVVDRKSFSFCFGITVRYREPIRIHLSFRNKKRNSPSTLRDPGIAVVL